MAARKKRKTKKTSKAQRPKKRRIVRTRGEREGDEILAERLVVVRHKNEVTRKVVAKKTRIPYESLTGYELGDQRPPFSRIRLLAMYYGVSLDYLAGRTERAPFRRKTTGRRRR